MSESEFYDDQWPPRGNDKRVSQFGMEGDKCLEYIKKNSNTTTWINPIFKKEWEYRDDSGTIEQAGNIIKMHDLTVGGVEDAIKDLMKKK